MNRLLFLGPPGAGKGTQAKIICNELKLLHLSTGDLLREEVASNSAIGIQVKSIMDKGELVSDQLVLSIVRKNLSNSKIGWVLDGFPRNVHQAKELVDLLKEIEQPIEAVILIDVEDDVLVKRLLSRGRPDDKEKVIRHRLKVYRTKTEPLIEFYKNQDLLKTVRGDGDINIICDRIKLSLC
tara:strand:- start:3528 stop:4073 length:546 start_codon:yes stop_codon:yes gene_type:complete